MNSVALQIPETAASLEAAIRRHARYSLARDWKDLGSHDRFNAVALAVRDRMVDAFLQTEERYQRKDARRLYYLSIEFLIGRSLRSNLYNLGLRDEFRQALTNLDADLDSIEETEPDAALGNGGLGRLAACFLDSLATLNMPGFGYGINYEYGLFRQEIDDGNQREKPDNWLAQSTPWQIARPDEACVVPVYGHIEHTLDRHGDYNPMWMDWKILVGMPSDMLVPGYGGRTVNYLRLYSARSSHDFDMGIFNDGDYFRAVAQKIESETISKVLYPSDGAIGGQELRLVQEYFLVACAVRDIVRRFELHHEDFRDFSSKVAIHLNDTHPALTVVELMRTLVDEKDLEWEEAWQITQATLGYTNHTLMPEALEKWPVPLFESVLPRHLQIIYEINRRTLDHVAITCPGDGACASRISAIEESAPKQIRMANLAMMGSHSINGVSRMHSELVRQSLAPDFFRVWPERFNNKSNGVTPRRWLLSANPGIAELISRSIGREWITDLDRLRALEKYSTDTGFQSEFRQIRIANKEKLARVVRETTHVRVDPRSLFDIQVKRIHLYKRQLLNVMHIIHEYLSLIEDGKEPAAPRTYLFAGKAAPGYLAARRVIRLIHDVARVINSDRRSAEWIRVAFIPDYRVSLAEIIVPAADLSEQISMAGTEASGTGNMKFALNGAITIGTPDGANLEILEEVGEENFFLFGMNAAEIQALRRSGSYDPAALCARDPRIARVASALRSKTFCPNSDCVLAGPDEYFHFADLAAYLDTQEKVAAAFRDSGSWTRMSILNMARMGKFSSDRAVREYARDIWSISKVE